MNHQEQLIRDAEELNYDAIKILLDHGADKTIMANHDLTYQKLINYLAGITNREKTPSGWSCGASRCYSHKKYQYFHCYIYILRKIKQKYVEESKGTYYEEEIPMIVREINGAFDTSCNACIFTPSHPEQFELFKNQPIYDAEAIWGLFDMKCKKLIPWMCKAFKVEDDLKENEKLNLELKKTTQNKWINKDGIDIKEFFKRESFWTKRLCPNQYQ